jgi:uncharacterized phage infection (PIP) family protein YhgE
MFGLLLNSWERRNIAAPRGGHMPSQDERLAQAFANIDQQFTALSHKLDKQQTTLDQIKKRLDQLLTEGIPRGR